MATSKMVYLTAMDENGQFTAKIAKWLREQGYPLEMRTARALAANDIDTTLGWYYADIETGQQRETDIYAYARRSYPDDEYAVVQISLAIECKSSKDKPWILFTDGPTRMSSTARRNQRFVSPDRKWIRTLQVESAELPLLDGYSPHGYALVRAFAGDNQDAAFGAMLSTAKAAAGIQRWHQQARRGEDTINSIVLPVLLVDAPLLQCELDSDGNERLTPIERGTIEWRYQLTPTDPPHTIITIATPDALPSLAEDLNATADEVLRLTTPWYLDKQAKAAEIRSKAKLLLRPPPADLSE
ncbi:hypothetical protein ACFTS5_12885 [Nocardia sp. NPDC056952]|uniref:hypothetical protein n=1 Tax=Nocardia sp. NPDC056952 TaxID=3345979 RepID=UPI003642B3EC